MPAARTLTVQPNTTHSITLERLARPGAGNYRLVRIPLTDVADGPEYTVEARRMAGYDDAHLPGEAVVIHHADMYRVSGDRWAQVVDPDNNWDVNDAGAQWTIGETFTDAAWGISVTVEAATATGFRITIVRRTSGLWMGLSPLLTPRKTFALAAAGGLLYVMGGLGDGAALNSVEAYDPAADRWENRAPMPTRRYDGTGAASIGGLLYVPGGRNASRILTKTLYVYKSVANTWSTKAPMPIASGCGGTVAIDGRLYVLTGCTAAGSATARLHRYTPSTDTWTARLSAPAAHSFPAVGALDGRLYVAGGRNAAGAATATLHVYDPATNTWSTGAPMPAVRFGAAGRVVNGKFYVVGGSSGQGVVGTVFVYDPLTNRWSSTTPMPSARTKLAVGAVGGRLYAVGGQAGSAALGEVERYTP
jgi:N-acetylneuraminic acid mutarotase